MLVKFPSPLAVLPVLFLSLTLVGCTGSDEAPADQEPVAQVSMPRTGEVWPEEGTPAPNVEDQKVIGHEPDAVFEGVWKGTMTHDTDGYTREWNIQLTFFANQGAVSGTTRIEAGGHFAVFDLRGAVSGSQVTALESRILSQQPPPPNSWHWCMSRSMTLDLVENERLSGTWYSPTPGCTGGRIDAVRTEPDPQ